MAINNDRYLLLILTVGVLLTTIGGIWLVLDSSFEDQQSASAGTVEFRIVPGEPAGIARENPTTDGGMSFQKVN